MLWKTGQTARDYELNEIRQRSANTLQLVVENLRGSLAKYSFQPRLLSNSKLMIDALQPGATKQEIVRANAELKRANGVTGASATYLMDKTGLTVAASNWDQPKAFVGRNFNYRPYFTQAINGYLGRFFALGTTSGKRGYYFSYPVRSEDGIIGVLVVKMDVTNLEADWKHQTNEILVVDNSGVVFLSSRPDWRLRTIEKLSADARQYLQDTRRYLGAPLKPLGLRTISNEGLVDVAAAPADTASRDGLRKRYLLSETPMQEAEWRVIILADAAHVEQWATGAVLLVATLLLSAALAAMNIYQRRRRLMERFEFQEAAKAELEAKVSDRTKDLSAANQQLREEITERQRAEADLNRTQEELIQASKLSALGSLSAGLSHELNQPLTAIRNYAENARVFLSRDDQTTTDANLGRIIEMGDRMSRIIRNLRTYARNESLEARPVRIVSPINEALALLEPQLRKSGVAVDLNSGDGETKVMGGDVRLQQVFVNLISNAIDAMAQTSERRLKITVTEDGNEAVVSVCDTGPGIGQGIIAQVFDPFFTTKEVGRGTGLGLSIAYGIIKRFGGSITVRDKPGTGAEFTIRLPIATAGREAAE
ncbi:MAG: ATP-binding protein [Filomicrobium sp.]